MIGATMSLLATVACHEVAASGKVGALAVPADEARLTPAQVADSKVVVEALTERAIDDTIVATGRITFDDLKVAHIYSPVTGRVTKIDAQVGQRVVKGEALATINSPDIGDVSSTLGKAQADLIAKQHAYERQKELFAAHATSQKALEDAEDDYRKAKAELDRAQAKAFLLHASGGASFSQSYTLLAPLDGEIIARDLSPGVEVRGLYAGSDAKELFTVGELDRIWILADLFEADLARVNVGAKVRVTVVSYPHEDFEGTVDYVANILDKETRTVRVRCTLPNPKRLLKPEMYATVALSVDARAVLAIPKSALLHLGESTMVFVEIGESVDRKIRFERRPVSVDEIDGAAFYPVQHGLERGEHLVIAGAEQLATML